MKMKMWLDWVVLILLFIGGINWGLIGLFHWGLIGAIFGHMSVVTRIIYVVVGVCAIYAIIRAFACCGCDKK